MNKSLCLSCKWGYRLLSGRLVCELGLYPSEKKKKCRGYFKKGADNV